MRLFLFGWDPTYRDQILVAEALRQARHEIVYWVTSADLNNKPEHFSEIIWHNHNDAWNGKGAEKVDAANFAPPGIELIKAFSKTESLILSMMNKRFDYLGVDERRHLYYNMLQYWHGVLLKYKPEAIIFISVPHTVYDYLVYELAQTMAIKTIMLEVTHVSDRVLILQDFRKGSQHLLDRLAENKGKQFQISDLSVDLQEYYKKQVDTAQDATPLYALDNRKNNVFIKRAVLRLKLAGRSILDGSIIKKAAGFIIKVFGENIKKEYASVEIKPDFDKPFVYIPLNYQPECTTSPQGDIFVDQILMIETVATVIPDDWVIYVKEHPIQWFPRGLNYSSVRYRGYYRMIASIINVYLIPRLIDTYFLIARCKMIATVTGTAGWEAILRSRPAIIFGHPWYQNCPSLLRAQDVESCRRAMKDVINGYKINQQAVLCYLKSLDEATIHGYREPYGQKNSQLTEEANARSIAGAILKELSI